MLASGFLPAAACSTQCCAKHRLGQNVPLRFTRTTSSKSCSLVLSADRLKLNAAIDEVTHQLEDARAAEYRSIVVSGKAYAPAEAARLVRSHQDGNDWIPGPVTHGAPLPLSVDEIADLYASNVHISQAEERELEGGLPNAGEVPNGQEFARLVAQAADTTEGDGQRYGTTEPDAAQISSLDGLHRMLSTIGAEVAR